jgi:hypothetical protein
MPGMKNMKRKVNGKEQRRRNRTYKKRYNMAAENTTKITYIRIRE